MPYGGMKGDYGPRTYRGDPGIFGFLGRAAKGIISTGIRAATGIRLPQRARPSRVLPAGPAGMIGYGLGAISRAGVGVGTKAAQKAAKAAAGEAPRRRRMQVTNPKALRRAIRRQTGFVKLARKALQGTGYTIVTRSSRAKPRVTVRESGPGSVSVR